MTDNYRYELKFVVNDIRLSEFFRWMWTQTSMVEAYPARSVNSLYFDDARLNAIRENITGLPNREKYRLRWYGESGDRKVEGLRLEKKVKRGRHGFKQFADLPGLEEVLLDTTLEEIHDQTREKFFELGLLDSKLDKSLISTLQVAYRRQYYKDLDDIRITIDDSIDFHQVNNCGYLFQGKPVEWQKKIIEVKFEPGMKNRVASLIRPLHLVPQRCSKYIQGMACNRAVMYL